MANIKADSSLVAAAYRASMAGVPKDMTKLMQSVVATHGQMVSSMAQGASIAMQGLTKSVTETQKHFAKLEDDAKNGDLPEDMQQKFKDDIQTMRDNLPNPFTNRKEFDAGVKEINKKIQYSKDNSTHVLGLIEKTRAENQGLLSPTIKKEDYDMAGQYALYVAGGDYDKDNFYVTKDEKGKDIYNFKITEPTSTRDLITGTSPTEKIITRSIKEIDQSIRYAKSDFILKTNQIIDSAETYAKTHPNAKFEEVFPKIQSDLNNSFKSDHEGYLDYVKTKSHYQTESIQDAFLNPESWASQGIHDALLKFNPNLDNQDGSDPKAKGDGKVTEGDFATTENYQAYVNAILSPPPELRDNAYKIVSEIVAMDQASKRFGVGERLRTGPNDKTARGWTIESGKTLPVFGGDRYAPPNVAKNMYNSISLAESGEDTSFNLFGVGYYYNKTRGTWLVGKNYTTKELTKMEPEEMAEVTIGNSSQLLQSLGINGITTFDNLIGTTASSGGVSDPLVLDMKNQGGGIADTF